VIGFQRKTDAERFWQELAERFRKFQLELHPEKTRLLEFGRFAAKSRQARGRGMPETFNFPGFTHICGKTWKTKSFTVLQQTMRKRLQAKLGEVKAELGRRMHAPIPELGAWLRSVVGGHIRYYGVPMNGVRWRPSLRQEPDAGKPLVRIRGGGRAQARSLLRPRESRGGPRRRPGPRSLTPAACIPSAAAPARPP
jgi:hypothetical protein